MSNPHGVDRNSASSGTGGATITPYMVEALRSVDDAVEAATYFGTPAGATDTAVAMAIALG